VHQYPALQDRILSLHSVSTIDIPSNRHRLLFQLTLDESRSFTLPHFTPLTTKVCHDAICPLRVVLIPQSPPTLNMPVEYANTSDDATLASHSPNTRFKPPFSLLSVQLASKNPKWRSMTQDEYEKMLKDPEQEESVIRAFWYLERELKESKWPPVKDPDFRAKQQTMLENADGDPITQINLKLAALPAYTRWSQAKFDEMKSEGGPAWDRMVERFNQVVEDLHIKVEPSQDQASLQDTADSDSVLGLDAPQATHAYSDLAQNTHGTNTIQALSCLQPTPQLQNLLSHYPRVLPQAMMTYHVLNLIHCLSPHIPSIIASSLNSTVYQLLSSLQLCLTFNLYP
jgi:hypothetical protein